MLERRERSLSRQRALAQGPALSRFFTFLQDLSIRDLAVRSANLLIYMCYGMDHGTRIPCVQLP